MKPFPLAPLLLLLLPLLLAAEGLGAQSLRGSRASVERIYRQARAHELHFYESGTGVRRAASRGTFVRLSNTRSYRVEGATFPYVLPSTELFIARLAAQYRAYCGERLVVTSGVRPKSLRLRNSTDKTVHPTGMAVDLRIPSRSRCRAWMRNTLLAVEREGVIDAVEERFPPHFHIAVFPSQYRRYVQRQGGSVKLAAAEKTSGSGTTATRRPSKGDDGVEPVRYRVRRGDTLWGIARRHGTSVEKLKDANGIRSSRVVAGQRLVIPGK